MNNHYNISDLQEYFSEEILLKFIKEELSKEDTEKVEFLLKNDASFSDMLDGLMMLENPEDIYLVKENVDKKIDTFSRNVKKQQEHKYKIIRQIVIVSAIILTTVFVISIVKSLIKIVNSQKVSYNKQGQLNTDKYDKIMYLSKDKYFIKDIVIRPEKELIIESYLVFDIEENKNNDKSKTLKKLFEKYDFIDEEYYLEKNPVFTTAHYVTGTEKYNSVLKGELSRIEKLKSFTIILEIPKNGGISNIIFYENKNNIEITEEITKIIKLFNQWEAAKSGNMKIDSKIAILVSSR
ncbi:MAG: hypothetical protein LBV69_11555 [Bacteroidales bacterium]|jgi:hypothetical protein|nr:hypothetical protein [Bacteroidales bacterium]